jgi:hypothetical protein
MFAHRDLARHHTITRFFGAPEGTEDPKILREVNARWRDWIISRSEWVYRVEDAPFNELLERVGFPAADQARIDRAVEKWNRVIGPQRNRAALPA